MARLALTGDVMLGRNIAEALETHGPRHVWGGLLDRLRAADGLFVNLESVIAETGTPMPDSTFIFQAPPAAVEALDLAGVDVASIANNHVLDMGEAALVEMLDSLDAAGIERVGSGRSIQEAWRPARVAVDGTTVGVLAFTDNVPSWDVERRQPGVAYAEVDPDGAGIERLEREIEGLSRAVDVVVVSAHWGPNMRRDPPEGFQQVARRLVDAGADLLWGHSAHLFQAVERYQDGVILYDAGDLVDDYRRDPEEHNEIGFLFEVEIARGRVGGVELVPVAIDPAACRVDPADASAAGFARERMRELCEPFGTPLKTTDAGGLRVPAEPGRG